MSAEGMSITVTVTRRSFFPRSISIRHILLDGMKYGTSKNGYFLEGESGDHFVIAYHTAHIGRGILFRWKPGDVRFSELTLNLPSSNEEIDDFFLMCARLARQDISEVMLNGKPFAPSRYHETVDRFKVYNLKLLHEMMGNVLNDGPDTISIGCAFHRLAAGEKEAETMWAGVNTDVYRDWMHSSQAPQAYFSEARVSSDGETATFTIPTGEKVIFPDHEELPIRFYDLKTGRPRFEIKKWFVELVDAERRVLGSMPFDKLQDHLPEEKKSYYDAADSLIGPLSVEEMQMILLQAEESDA